MENKYPLYSYNHEYSIKKILERLNRPLNCTDWSEEPPYTEGDKLTERERKKTYERIIDKYEDVYITTPTEKIELGWEFDIFIDNVDEVVNLLNTQDDKIKEQSEIIAEQGCQLDFLKDENIHMREILEKNKRLENEILLLKSENKRLKYMKELENKIWNAKIGM